MKSTKTGDNKIVFKTIDSLKKNHTTTIRVPISIADKINNIRVRTGLDNSEIAGRLMEFALDYVMIEDLKGEVIEWKI